MIPRARYIRCYCDVCRLTMCSVSIAKNDEETENEKLSCFDAHIRCHRMPSFFRQFLRHSPRHVPEGKLVLVVCMPRLAPRNNIHSHHPYMGYVYGSIVLLLSAAVIANRPPHATGPAARSPDPLPAPPPKSSTIDCEQKTIACLLYTSPSPRD